MKSMVILISGRGSNLPSLFETDLPLDIKAVISNRPDAPGLKLAEKYGAPTRVVDHKQFPDREAFDAALAREIDTFDADFVVCAGFMRVLTAGFVEHYRRRLINIHPSLLPAFPGLHTHREAIAQGCKIHGCTVHIVTPALDHGPIIIQAAVPVFPHDTPEVLAARVMQQEHRIYPQALRWLAEGRVEFISDAVVKIHHSHVFEASLVSPELN
jgi:phosphoribosylglycinamide formyltransferase-1